MAEGVSHVQKLQHCKQKIEEMQGTSVEIKYKNQVVKWTVIEYVNPPISHGPPERQNLGIQDFDYSNIPRDEVFAPIFFLLMWIGIDEQLIKSNASIDEHNESLPVSSKKIKIFSKSEIILGYALFVAAARFSEKGIHLFNTEDNVESFLPPPSFSTYMKFHRFKLWKQFIVKVNEDGARKRDSFFSWKKSLLVRRKSFFSWKGRKIGS
jgi:hypothetical protein